MSAHTVVSNLGSACGGEGYQIDTAPKGLETGQPFLDEETIGTGDGKRGAQGPPSPHSRLLSPCCRTARVRSSALSARWSSLSTCGATKTRLVTSRHETSSPTAPGSFQSVSKGPCPALCSSLSASAWAGRGGRGFAEGTTLP